MKPMHRNTALRISGFMMPNRSAKTSHRDPAEGGANHRRHIGDGGPTPTDPKFSFDRRQHDDRRPQADAADRADRQGREEPYPRVAAVGKSQGLR